jgi:hypothetical protein
MPEPYRSRNLKAPAKPITRQAREARKQESAAILADLERQAVSPSVVTKASLGAKGPKLLHIPVPDNDDWYSFCADLLMRGQAQWLWQGDREARHNKNDGSIPQFKTWTAFRKALLQVGERYWETTGAQTRRRGRPDMMGRCWRALWKELTAARATGRMTYRRKDLVPLINGSPITQEEVQRMIKQGDPGHPLYPHDLSKEACKKYGRLLYLSFKLTHPEQLTHSDDAFLTTYFLPFLKKSLPDLVE